MIKHCPRCEWDRKNLLVMANTEIACIHRSPDYSHNSFHIAGMISRLIFIDIKARRYALLTPSIFPLSDDDYWVRY